VSIYIGATGPQMMALTGEIAWGGAELSGCTKYNERRFSS